MTRGCGWFAPPKALARKRSAAAASRLAESKKSIVAPVESTARYKYTHLPFTRTYVSSTRQLSLVSFESPTQTLFHFRAIALDPRPDGDVIGAQAPLGEQLLHVAVRKGKAQVPPHCQQDDLRLKLPPLE